MSKDYRGKTIPSHKAWENSKEDEALDRKGSAHKREGSKADFRADEEARKKHNAAVKKGR